MKSMDSHYCHEDLCILVLFYDCSATSLPVIKLQICIPYVSTELAEFQFCPLFHHREDNNDRNENNNDAWQKRRILSVGFAVLWKMVFITYLALGGKNKACGRIYTLSSRSQT
jgi:hypothetical protein